MSEPIIIIRDGKKYRKDKKGNLRKCCTENDCTTYSRPRTFHCSKHGGAKICSEVNCKTPAQADGKCVKHEGYKICEIDNCERRVAGRGLCLDHAEHLRCEKDGCDKLQRSGYKFCYKHGPRSIKDKANKRRNQRLKEDVNYRLIKNYRTRIWNAIKNNKRFDKTLDLLGCDVLTLRTHLEKKFQKGMNWCNYGEWHVDHIIPCASFDLSKREEQNKCFHYSNTQPLWATDNRSKANKI